MMKWFIGLIFMVGIANAADRPLIVILMGPPGAGKGTHAGPLSHELALPHISTGDLFREHIRSQTPFGLKAQGYIDQGHLVPDELVLQMLFERVGQTDCRKGYILDGFPRTLSQAKALDRHLSGRFRVAVLHFHLSDGTIVERIAGRIICKGCGRPYHRKWGLPQKEGVCDICGSALYQRDDDKEEVVCKRLEVYRTQTQPLIDYYTKQPEVLYEIDGQKDKAAVFRDILDTLPLSTAK